MHNITPGEILRIMPVTDSTAVGSWNRWVETVWIIMSARELYYLARLAVEELRVAYPLKSVI